LHHRPRRRSGLRARVGTEAVPGDHPPGRSPTLLRGRGIGMPELPVAEIERVFREEYGRAVAVLIRAFDDIGTAEEAVQEAFLEAVQRWPSAGLPPSPAGWIITTARNRAIDHLRREGSREYRHEQAAEMLTPEEPEE